MTAPSAAVEPSARRLPSFAEWFERERADALTTVRLTSRPGLEVRREPGSPGPQTRTVVVRGEHGLPAGKFEVHWGGTRDAARFEDPPASPPADGTVLDPTLPAVQFLFNVVADDGKYRWLIRPTGGDGGLEDESGEAGGWRPLDAAALDQIVAEVVDWYQACRDRLAA